ncbi:60S ribosomal protein L21-1-like isoform X1 [Populus alba x Populus x berolinensis]|nr:60S ribosomal protein L21-1-like isoform X1 [Populus alba x Populus x berolinensis]
MALSTKACPTSSTMAAPVASGMLGIRIIGKRIHVRVEHVQPSRCREEFKLRKKKNDELKAEAQSSW